VAGLAAAFGSGAMTNSIAGIETSKCILVIGSNTTECHPLIARRIFKAKEKGSKLIVVDPRKVQIAEYADLFIQHRAGTDVALLNGVMHIIIENGWHARPYIQERTEGFDDLRGKLKDYPPEKVEDITGVSRQDLEELARIYATNSPASLLYCMGITQHTTGTDNVKSCCNLSMLCGYVGVPGGGVNPLRGQNNVQGACDLGGLPNVFPGYTPVTDPEANKKFSEAWDRALPDQVGYTLTDMIQAMLDGRLRALYVIGENPMMSDPDLAHVEKAISNLDLLIVQDIFRTETVRMADVVFAAATSAEKQGTFTNSERRVQLLHKAVEPPGRAMQDWQITCKLASALGYPMSYDTAEEIFDELAALTPIYAGMNYERLGLDGLQWPCPSPDHPGTPYLHKDTFSRGKGKFHALEFIEPAETPDETYPYLLSTGRNFAHFHTGTMTRVSPHLAEEQETAYVEMNSEDGAELSVRDGDRVRVSSRRGTVELSVRFSGHVRSGMVFIPFHFAEAPANILTNPVFDPIAKIPEYKVCAVKIEKAG